MLISILKSRILNKIALSCTTIAFAIMLGTLAFEVKDAHAVACFLPNESDCGDGANMPDTSDCFERWRAHSHCQLCENGFYECGDCEEGYVLDEKGKCVKCPDGQTAFAGKCYDDQCPGYTLNSPLDENEYICYQCICKEGEGDDCPKSKSKNYRKWKCDKIPEVDCKSRGYTVSLAEKEEFERKRFTCNERCRIKGVPQNWWKECKCEGYNKYIDSDGICQTDSCVGTSGEPNTNCVKDCQTCVNSKGETLYYGCVEYLQPGYINEGGVCRLQTCEEFTKGKLISKNNRLSGKCYVGENTIVGACYKEIACACNYGPKKEPEECYNCTFKCKSGNEDRFECIEKNPPADGWKFVESGSDATNDITSDASSDATSDSTNFNSGRICVQKTCADYNAVTEEEKDEARYCYEPKETAIGTCYKRIKCPCTGVTPKKEEACFNCEREKDCPTWLCTPKSEEDINPCFKLVGDMCEAKTCSDYKDSKGNPLVSAINRVSGRCYEAHQVCGGSNTLTCYEDITNSEWVHEKNDKCYDCEEQCTTYGDNQKLYSCSMQIKDGYLLDGEECRAATCADYSDEHGNKFVADKDKKDGWCYDPVSTAVSNGKTIRILLGGSEGTCFKEKNCECDGTDQLPDKCWNCTPVECPESYTGEPKYKCIQNVQPGYIWDGSECKKKTCEQYGQEQNKGYISPNKRGDGCYIEYTNLPVEGTNNGVCYIADDGLLSPKADCWSCDEKSSKTKSGAPCYECSEKNPLDEGWKWVNGANGKECSAKNCADYGSERGVTYYDNKPDVEPGSDKSYVETEQLLFGNEHGTCWYEVGCEGEDAKRDSRCWKCEDVDCPDGYEGTKYTCEKRNPPEAGYKIINDSCLCDTGYHKVDNTDGSYTCEPDTCGYINPNYVDAATKAANEDHTCYIEHTGYQLGATTGSCYEAIPCPCTNTTWARVDSESDLPFGGSNECINKELLKDGGYCYEQRDDICTSQGMVDSLDPDVKCYDTSDAKCGVLCFKEKDKSCTGDQRWDEDSCQCVDDGKIYDCSEVPDENGDHPYFGYTEMCERFNIDHCSLCYVIKDNLPMSVLDGAHIKTDSGDSGDDDGEDENINENANRGLCTSGDGTENTHACYRYVEPECTKLFKVVRNKFDNDTIEYKFDGRVFSDSDEFLYWFENEYANCYVKDFNPNEEFSFEEYLGVEYPFGLGDDETSKIYTLVPISSIPILEEGKNYEQGYYLVKDTCECKVNLCPDGYYDEEPECQKGYYSAITDIEKLNGDVIQCWNCYPYSCADYGKTMLEAYDGKNGIDCKDSNYRNSTYCSSDPFVHYMDRTIQLFDTEEDVLNEVEKIKEYNMGYVDEGRTIDEYITYYGYQTSYVAGKLSDTEDEDEDEDETGWVEHRCWSLEYCEEYQIIGYPAMEGIEPPKCPDGNYAAYVGDASPNRVMSCYICPEDNSDECTASDGYNRETTSCSFVKGYTTREEEKNKHACYRCAKSTCEKSGYISDSDFNEEEEAKCIAKGGLPFVKSGYKEGTNDWCNPKLNIPEEELEDYGLSKSPKAMCSDTEECHGCEVCKESYTIGENEEAAKAAADIVAIAKYGITEANKNDFTANVEGYATENGHYCARYTYTYNKCPDNWYRAEWTKDPRPCGNGRVQFISELENNGADNDVNDPDYIYYYPNEWFNDSNDLIYTAKQLEEMGDCGRCINECPLGSIAENNENFASMQNKCYNVLDHFYGGNDVAGFMDRLLLPNGRSFDEYIGSGDGDDQYPVNFICGIGFGENRSKMVREYQQLAELCKEFSDAGAVKERLNDLCHKYYLLNNCSTVDNEDKIQENCEVIKRKLAGRLNVTQAHPSVTGGWGVVGYVGNVNCYGCLACPSPFHKYGNPNQASVDIYEKGNNYVGLDENGNGKHYIYTCTHSSSSSGGSGSSGGAPTGEVSYDSYSDGSSGGSEDCGQCCNTGEYGRLVENPFAGCSLSCQGDCQNETDSRFPPDKDPSGSSSGGGCEQKQCDCNGKAKKVCQDEDCSSACGSQGSSGDGGGDCSGSNLDWNKCKACACGSDQVPVSKDTDCFDICHNMEYYDEYNYITGGDPMATGSGANRDEACADMKNNMSNSPANTSDRQQWFNDNCP